jgi:hypothetical protein
LDTNELIRLAEHELAGGDPSAAREMAWRAHDELFSQRDAEGLERLLAVVSRIEGSGNLNGTIRHDLEWLRRRSQGQPDAVMDSFAIVGGALAGVVVAIALAYLALHGEPEADAFVWLASLLFLLFVCVPTVSVLAWLLGRRSQSKR